jgi:hypothetical protein
MAKMAPAVKSEGPEGFHADFTLSVTRALRDQLEIALSGLTKAALTQVNLDRLLERAGVYQLYLHDELVYVGKADKTLPGRLKKHMRKISGRENIDLPDVQFCCLYVAEDFTALAPEKLLISRYDQTGRAMWNHNGFGNNDPGRRRDLTAVKANHFDRAYPAALNRTVDGLASGEIQMKELLKKIKSGLPFNFRYAVRDLGPAANETIDIESSKLTADQAFSLVARRLPPRWQIVALPGYSIMYPDSPDAYLSARRYYRGSKRIDAEPQFSEAGDIEDDNEESDAL